MQVLIPTIIFIFIRPLYLSLDTQFQIVVFISKITEDTAQQSICLRWSLHFFSFFKWSNIMSKGSTFWWKPRMKAASRKIFQMKLTWELTLGDIGDIKRKKPLRRLLVLCVSNQRIHCATVMMMDTRSVPDSGSLKSAEYREETEKKDKIS